VSLQQQLAGNPAIIHITHAKAGSQWIRQILMSCVPDLVVPSAEQLSADPGQSPSWQFLDQPIVPGAVYPALYLPKDYMDRVEGSDLCRRFIVIRDLRDTLVSGYFSIRYTHPTHMEHIVELRAQLESRTVEDGLIFLFDGFTDMCAAVQATWMESGVPMLRYEDLLLDDVNLLENVLLDHCGLPVTRALLRETIEAHRFQRLSGGRPLGQEDRSSHYRKGTPGDWRNHFTPKVTDAFKARFGNVLIYTGYEKDNDW
jgi:hypothetical protein